MNKLSASLATAAILFGTSANLFALDFFKKQFNEVYTAGAGASPDFVKAVKTANCKVCHFGPAKADRNDYGKTLSKWLKKDAFTKAKIDADPEGKAQAVRDALEMAAREASPAGGTYGDRLKAGMLPGTVEKKE